MVRSKVNPLLSLPQEFSHYLLWNIRLSHISHLITQKCLKSRSNMAGSCHHMMSAHINCKHDSAGFHSYSTDLVLLLSPFFSWTLNLRPLFFRSMVLGAFVLILRCREGEGADGVLEIKMWGGVAKRLLESGVLSASEPWWLQRQGFRVVTWNIDSSSGSCNVMYNAQ